MNLTLEQIEAIEEENEAQYQAMVEWEAGKTKPFIPAMMKDEPEGGLEDE